MHRFGNRRGGLTGCFVNVCLAAGLVFPATSAQATVAPSEAAWQSEERYWNFRVFLDDREIGFHEFRVQDDGSEQRVEIDAQFDVKVLFINAYSYRHSNLESWRGGCLASIRSSTDDNGDRLEVEGQTGPQGFVLGKPDGSREVVGECIRSFAYWNPEILSAGQLLNAQTGELVNVSVEDRGTDILSVGDQVLPARQYRLTMEDGTIDLWYHGDSGQWLALKAPTEGGRVLRYEPIGLPLQPGDGDRLVME